MKIFEGKFDRPLFRYKLILSNLVFMGVIFVIGFVLILLDNKNDLGRFLLSISASLNLINFYLSKRKFTVGFEMRNEGDRILLVSNGKRARELKLPITVNTDLSLEPMRSSHKLVKRLILSSPVTGEYIIISEPTSVNDGSPINEKIRYSDYLSEQVGIVESAYQHLKNTSA